MKAEGKRRKGSEVNVAGLGFVHPSSFILHPFLS
jgi:hypothetical protein